MMYKQSKNRLSQLAGFFVAGPKFSLNVPQVRLASNFTRASNLIQLRKSPFSQSQLVRFKRLFFVIGLVLFILPQTSFAAGTRRATATASPSKASFCASVDVFAEKMKKDMAANEARFFDKDAGRQAQLDEKLSRQDAERQNTRFTWDSSRDKVYTDFLSRATTANQKDAIKKFRNAVDAAVEARRKSVDAANTNFKTSIDATQKQRKTAVENATALFKSDADKALAAAKANCANGKSSADARTMYVSALEGAQKKLQTSLSQIKNDTSLSTLINARQKAIEQAGKDFKTAMTKAQDELKDSNLDSL